jgi:mannose/fructose/N-acetylgalactosamine-specific phosphotransferase system component IIB
VAIVLVRVDQRLLHGQVVEGWVPFLKVDTVVVADDLSASDPLVGLAMTAACPAKVKLSVLKVADAAAAVTAGNLPGTRTLVLVSSVAVLNALWKQGARASAVNVGNVPIGPGRKRVTMSVALSAEELAQLEEVAATGAQVEARAVPKEKAADLHAMHEAVDK